MIKFSVIMPTYNRYETKLPLEALNSVLKQSPGNYSFEIIVVDDASPGTGLQEFQKQFTGLKEVSFIKLSKNLGTPGAIQAGIKGATGDYIVILGDDDLLPPTSLKERAEFINNHPDLDWFYAKTQLLDSNGNGLKTISQSEKFEDHHYARMFLYNYIQGGTTTVKKAVYDKLKWPEWLTSRDDDFIAFELVRPGKHKYSFLDAVVYGYRKHEIDERQSQKNLLEKSKLDEMDRRIRYELHDPELAFLADKARGAAICEAELQEREERLSVIYNSLFWKITKPIRFIKRKLS